MFLHQINQDIHLEIFDLRHTCQIYELFLQNREHLAPELDWLSQEFTPADVKMYIKAGLQRFADNNGFRAGIWWQGQLAGCIGLHSLDWESSKASLGYWLAAQHQGKGIVGQCCKAVIGYGFTQLDLERIEIQCAADNSRSRAVAERLGFSHEGVLRNAWRRQGQFVDLVVYSVLQAEWSKR